MQISCIVAMAQNRAIGINNQLPWHLPADLKHFKSVTMSKPILMGRKTYESIGRPLPGRENIVLTRDQNWSAEGVTVVHSLEVAIEHAEIERTEELMIIGGAEIYRLVLPKAHKLYVTEVDVDVEGDAFFPEIPLSEWKETSRQAFEPEGGKPAYAFVDYIRA